MLITIHLGYLSPCSAPPNIVFILFLYPFKMIQQKEHKKEVIPAVYFIYFYVLFTSSSGVTRVPTVVVVAAAAPPRRRGRPTQYCTVQYDGLNGFSPVPPQSFLFIPF